jgi:hypothetical protein
MFFSLIYEAGQPITHPPKLLLVVLRFYARQTFYAWEFIFYLWKIYNWQNMHLFY